MRAAQDLELDEDTGFQAREMRFQHVGWGILCLFVLTAVSGLLGGGPLSTAHMETDILRIDYHRFTRREAKTPLDITYRRKAGDTSLVLEFDSSCLIEAELEEARPNPKGAMARAGEGLSFEFDLAPAAEWTRLHFLLRPSKAGARHCKVTAEGRSTLAFDQFVLP